jgi:hypothetical protein
MSVELTRHLEEGERLLALVASDAEERLFEQLAQWTADLYTIVEEGSEECSPEELQQAKDINDQIIARITEIKEELAREIMKTRKGSDAVKAYQGK